MAFSWSVVRAELKSTSAMTRAFPVCVDDDEVVRADAPQADPVGGVGVGGPVPLVLRVVEELLLLEELQDLADLDRPELLPLLEGQFEGAALDVADQDGEVVRVDEGRSPASW